MQLRTDREGSSVYRLLQKLALRKLIREINPYHPIHIEGQTISAGERNCQDRWLVIQKVIAESRGTVLDLGCAEGYFVQRAAREYGSFVLGVDADLRRLTIAQDTNLLNKNERAGFMYAHITPEFLSQIPAFDTVIFLSVLHHIMYEHGIDYARRFMKLIREKTAKSLIFDMGQSNETAMEWASLLPDMGPNPEIWIKEFLRSCGFSNVTEVGQTDAYKSSVVRTIFLARP
ncbi:MAG TPA: DUF1698 domain-containing protein [Acidobacteriaceae bacterium]|jgi:cyclopropane fatty-acyl-phospholipid synthase-like methyltransferase|nr:DUF1698 domain-containing protein [Acidobacteriaceae bacterium]